MLLLAVAIPIVFFRMRKRDPRNREPEVYDSNGVNNTEDTDDDEKEDEQ